MIKLIGFFLLSLTFSHLSAEEIGEVSTSFKMIGANHKITIEAFDDEGVPGSSCFLSRAKTGGISGAFGLAEDPSDASIACRQIGKITLIPSIKNGDEDGNSVFKASSSVLFKSIQVVRFYDKKRNALIYLIYSDKLVDGSPKNSISVVPLNQW